MRRDGYFPRGGLARVTHPKILQALRRARDLTDRDFAQPLTLDAMAAAAKLSKFHFARAFTMAYGETPHTYLTRRRVERAKDLLRVANLTTTEICFCVGFESVGSFSSRFKELVGMSPSEYRRSAASAPPIPGCFRPDVDPTADTVANAQPGRSTAGRSKVASGK